MRVPSVALISLQVVVLVLFSSTNQSVEAVKWPGAYINGFREYIINLVNERLISKSSMVKTYRETIKIIANRYDLENSQLPEGATEEDKSSLYYKIVVDELRNLREKLEKKQNEKVVDNLDDANDDFNMDDDLYDGLPAPDKFLAACKNCVQQLPEEDPLIDEENLELTNQLNDLENLDKEEDEMGWSLDPESRALLQQRTKKVVGDLIQNELRQIAFAILQSYMTGNAIGPVVLAVSSTIKYKLFEYLLTNILDVLAHILGKRVEDVPSIVPLPKQPTV